MNEIKENIKALVKNKGISMAQLARSTDIPPQTLNNWFNNHPDKFKAIMVGVLSKRIWGAL